MVRSKSDFAHIYYYGIICNFIFVELFANGDDFSWETIQTGRNTYYQMQTVSSQIIK